MHSRLIMRFTSFASGSGGNCGLLRAGDTRILFDAGISLRRSRSHLAQQALTMQDISAVFLTHAHRDHVAGLRMLCKYHTLPVFATAETCAILRREAPEVIPRLCEIETQRAVELPDGLTVTAFPTMHDIQGSAGYVVGHNGLRFGLCTDLGCVTDEVFEALCGVQAAMLEDKSLYREMMTVITWTRVKISTPTRKWLKNCFVRFTGRECISPTLRLFIK